MNGIHVLNKMFGYDTPIPNAPVTRSFRIGVYSSGYKRTDKYEERVKQSQVKPVKDPNALKPSEKRMLLIVQCNDGITAVKAAQKTGWTQNHCSIILATLHKRGLIRRVKRTAPNIRFYEYFKNDSA
jgi:hypothetical protein